MNCAVDVVNGRHPLVPSLLLDGQTSASVAAECRTAALDFMAGVADGWTKFDLALWLRGPYALAARNSHDGDRAPISGTRRALRPSAIESLLVQTRGRVLAALERAVLANGQLDELVERALIARHVRHAVDEVGAYVSVPVDSARMRLEDRVASLFAADYMNDARAYSDLFVCHHCEAVVFEADARARDVQPPPDGLGRRAA